MTDLRNAAKLALEALEEVRDARILALELKPSYHETIAALKRALAEDAMDRMAENARELGLDYEPDLATVGEVGVWGKPVAVWVRPNGTNNSGVAHFGETCPPGWVAAAKPYYTRPQPAAFTPEIAAILSENQRLRAELKFNGSQPSAWVGLTDEERRELRKRNQQHDALMLATEKLLKEKNRE